MYDSAVVAVIKLNAPVPVCLYRLYPVNAEPPVEVGKSHDTVTL